MKIQVRCPECKERHAVEMSADEARTQRPTEITCDACWDAIQARDTRAAQRVQGQQAQARQAVQARRGMPYKQYLQSEYWQGKRLYFLRRALGRCEHCGVDGWDTQLHVHHLTYENRGNERENDCIVLCKHCHAYVHNKLSEDEYKQWCVTQQQHLLAEYATRQMMGKRHADVYAQWQQSPMLVDNMRNEEVNNRG